MFRNQKGLITLFWEMCKAVNVTYLWKYAQYKKYFGLCFCDENSDFVSEFLYYSFIIKDHKDQRSFIIITLFCETWLILIILHAILRTCTLQNLHFLIINSVMITPIPVLNFRDEKKFWFEFESLILNFLIWSFDKLKTFLSFSSVTNVRWLKYHSYQRI